MSVKKQVNLDSLYFGSEPEWGNSKKELSFCRALSWYSSQKDWKDSKKYAIDYAKSIKLPKQIIEKLDESSENLFTNVGFLCRMIQRGAPLDKADWIIGKFEQICSSKHNPSSLLVATTTQKQEVTIQDRIYDQSSLFISQIEDYVDSFIQTKRKINFNPYDWMTSNMVKSVHAKQICDHFKPILSEVLLAISKKDSDLVEGYSNFSKNELKCYYDLINSIVEDSNKIINNSKITRKTRKKKAVSLDKKVSKVQYKKEDTEFKLVSISPTEIIGATRLWVFNTKYKRLGCYVSVDDSGFGIKGTSLLGFDDIRSTQKTLRKPLEVLPKIANGKKADLNKIMSTIKCKESILSGRLNSDVVLLKVIK